MQKWDERFSEEGFAYGVEPNDFLREKLENFPVGAKVLCIAEGEGRNALGLLKRGCEVHGVDLSSVGKEKALAFTKENGFEMTYEIADLFEYDFGEEKWDGIVSIFFHCPTGTRMEFHQKLERALKPGGLYLFEAYAKDQPEFGTGGPKDEELLYTTEDFKNSNLEQLHLEGVKREIIEGKYHTGMSSVIQYLGKK